jgi:hypothetical protein
MIALIATLIFAAAPSASDLDARIDSQPGWVGYKVPMIEGAGVPCCYEWHGKARRVGCDLDSRSWSFGEDDEHSRVAASDSLSVYWHVEHGRADKIRAIAASCPVDSAQPIRWLDDVAPADSVAALAQWMRDRDDKHADDGLPALAYHADKAATAALAELAGPSHADASREQALFWLGQARGAEGAAIVDRVATSDADPELRAKAIFALSQSHADDPYLRIRAISSRDASEHVRSQALFWMAQMHDARARADITAAVRAERSEDAREQAVFALSQLDDADAALIAIVRGDFPRSAKGKALFWLGQSGSDQAIAFLDEVLTKTASR